MITKEEYVQKYLTPYITEHRQVSEVVDSYFDIEYTVGGLIKKLQEYDADCYLNLTTTEEGHPHVEILRTRPETEEEHCKRVERFKERLDGQ